MLHAAESGALVLTVNKRLARYLNEGFDRRMVGQGRGAWKTPAIYSLDGWLLRAAAQTGDEWRLPGSFSAQRLWEKVIEQDGAGTALGLLQLPATARQAMEAHRLLVEYRAEVKDVPLTEDHLAFLRWRKGYLEALADGDWLDPAALVGCIARVIGRGEFAVPARVALAGFDELNPAIQELCRAFAAVGCTVEACPPDGAPQGTLTRLPCADVADEVRRAARWARRLVEDGEQRIGIIVPALERYRPLIERIFREEIDPPAQLNLDEQEEKFSLSLGSSLARQGMVTAALGLLGCGTLLELDQASFLLRSPFFSGGLGEAGGRAEIETSLRRAGVRQLSLKRLKSLIREGVESGRWRPLPALETLLRALETNLAGTGKQLPSQWAGHFTVVLGAAGWPGERALSSLDYQVFKAWQEHLLPALAALDAVSAPMARGEALRLLRRLAQEILFQPEGQSGPLQVLGVLEAAGIGFDHLWVMGLTEDSLPAPPRPNPFLPVSIQVAHRMPHASAARELEFAGKVMNRLLAGAPVVMLSHPVREGDCELRPSPLIAHLPAGEVVLAPGNAPAALQLAKRPDLEQILDIEGPPMIDPEPVSGGTSVLKDQALCPFRAFAHHRLAAKAIESPDIGLDAGTRGTLLHGVLERFWEQTRSRAALQALSEAKLRQRIDDCVQAALDSHFGDRAGETPRTLVDIERRRLGALVLEWLTEVELERSDFSVEELEKTHRECFGGLVINTKVDRIDRLDDGSRVILDYKTGRPDLGDLLGERLLEPQLPVYGVGEGGNRLVSAAFAVVRSGECGFKGVARSGGLLPRVEEFAASKVADKHGIDDWDALLRRWRDQLNQLGGDFLAGKAAVDPVDPVKACRYCDLASLCRINEIQPLVGGEE